MPGMLEIWGNTLLRTSSAFYIRKLSLTYANPEVLPKNCRWCFPKCRSISTFCYFFKELVGWNYKIGICKTPSAVCVLSGFYPS